MIIDQYMRVFQNKTQGKLQVDGFVVFLVRYVVLVASVSKKNPSRTETNASDGARCKIYDSLVSRPLPYKSLYGLLCGGKRLNSCIK